MAIVHNNPIFGEFLYTQTVNVAEGGGRELRGGGVGGGGRVGGVGLQGLTVCRFALASFLMSLQSCTSIS